MRGLIVIAIFLFSFAWAEESRYAKLDIEYDKLFLESVAEVSDIATKTKLNIDNMPAFVSIIREKDLRTLGVKDLYEALTLIPGVEPSIENLGAKTLIFRGVKEKGKIKLLVDGVTINNNYRGSIYHYINFPIDIIKRIEVIRGPGSVLYGSNAIAGVINIVTKSSEIKNGLELSTAVGSYDYLRGSFTSYNKLENFSLNLDGYYQKSNKKIDTGPDKGGSYGESDERLKDYSLGINIEGKQLSFIARIKKNLIGSAYGIGSYLIDENQEKDILTNNTLFSELKYKNELASNFSYMVKAGYTEYLQQFDTIHSIHPVNEELSYQLSYEERAQYLEAVFNANCFDTHELIIGASVHEAQELDNNYDVHYVTTPDTKLYGDSLLSDDAYRVTKSLYVNDQIQVGEELDLSAGVRYDNYSDFGSATSPRIGLVYRLSNENNIKVMYSSAFRAPSFIESYASIEGLSLGNSDLDAETSNTVEVGFIHKKSIDNLTRINFYHTKINDVIYREPISKQYMQHGHNTLYGFELENRTPINKELKLRAAFAYVKGEDQDGSKIPEVANVTANGVLTYAFGGNFLSSTVLKYVSQRDRVEGDSREELGGYTTIDQSFNIFYKDTNFAFKINNILDEEVKYPSPVGRYVDDYDREGRNLLLTISKEF